MPRKDRKKINSWLWGGWKNIFFHLLTKCNAELLEPIEACDLFAFSEVLYYINALRGKKDDDSCQQNEELSGSQNLLPINNEYTINKQINLFWKMDSIIFI